MSILEDIKVQTRPEHESLESKLNLLRPDFSLDDYKNVITRFYGLYRSWEEKILTADLPFSYVPRLKYPHLEEDLLLLGFSKEDISKIPLHPSLPVGDDLASLMGMIYVIEGSTLGGQVLNKHFGMTLRLSKFFFFSGYGEKTIPFWREFQGQLLKFSEENPSKNNRIIENAKKTFTSFESWLV